MSEVVKDESNTKTKNKKHASFIKIYIKSDDFKLNMIPIPLWLAKGFITSILRLYRFSKRFSNHDDHLSKHDINEILHSTKIIIKELKKYPPFSIVEIENKDTSISIRTK